MSRIITTEEFTTRRKIRGTGPHNGEGSSTNLLRSKQYPLTPLSVNASLSPYKAYYERDADGVKCYYIEFNIGNFQFDEISIRTEGQHRLIVQGKSKTDNDDICREFTRDFSLPKNVDQYSIKAQLEETTRVLTLIGQVESGSSRSTSAATSLAGSVANSAVSSQANMRSLMEDSIISDQSTASTSTINASNTTNFDGISYGDTQVKNPPNHKLGSIRENKTKECIDYEIFLGDELKNGQVSLDMVGYNTLVVKVVSSDWDSSGDYNLELKRQIKLPFNADSQHTQHGVDPVSALLLIKVPFK